mmetsp:Transcript_14564/g.30978  ORF Transcript_14564/g.30978 Transcript_14564/m.30978 type:complete len:160 (+) Transcript_14564:88-567(+)
MAKPNASGAAAESGGAATNDAGNHHPQQHQQLTESFVRAFDKQRSTLAGFARCSNLEELHVVRDGFYLGMAKDLCPDEYKRVLVMVLKRKFGSSNGNGNGDGDGDTAEEQRLDGDETAPTAPSGPSVENYLFIFLKFVSCMIPTINYDFTMEVTADTSK